MLPKVNPTTTQAWKLLQEHFSEMKDIQMRKLFQSDPARFTKFSLHFDDILFDYSKNRISEKTIQLLLQLAEECKLKEAINAMYSGDVINGTEKRSVLHTALRNFSRRPVFAEGNDVMPGIKNVLGKMKTFSDNVHKGKHRGYTGKRRK
jgi:glucose-6-phosphate isomerase